MEIEREGRGDRAKVWVLAPGLSSDAPGGQPVDAGPSPEAELAAAREQVRALQELADYRGKLLDEAEWRYRGAEVDVAKGLAIGSETAVGAGESAVDVG